MTYKTNAMITRLRTGHRLIYPLYWFPVYWWFTKVLEAEAQSESVLKDAI